MGLAWGEMPKDDDMLMSLALAFGLRAGWGIVLGCDARPPRPDALLLLLVAVSADIRGPPLPLPPLRRELFAAA